MRSALGTGAGTDANRATRAEERDRACLNLLSRIARESLQLMAAKRATTDAKLALLTRRERVRGQAAAALDRERVIGLLFSPIAQPFGLSEQ